MYLFSKIIKNWEDWGKVFQSSSVFSPLAEHIFRAEDLPFCAVEKLTPGTNAVFKIGKYVLKIFAPEESGFCGIRDMQTEIFAMCFAKSLGVGAPALVAEGIIQDRYRFGYLVMEYIAGISFSEAVRKMSEDEKRAAAGELRRVTDRMNVPCSSFNRIDAFRDSERARKWNQYPDHFRRDRLNYIRNHAYEAPVFVHGDLNGDNLLLGQGGELSVLDFADALLAPRVYEDALVASELFDFDRALLEGYFGAYHAEELAQVCLDGLLIHAFGSDVVEQHVGAADEFRSVQELYEAIKKRIEEGVTFTPAPESAGKG